MARILGNISIVFTLLLLQCKTDSEIIPESHYSYIIHLTKDLKILDVEYYIENDLRFKSIYNYSNDKVQINTAYDKIGHLRISTYFLGNTGLADSCIDSMFNNKKISQVFISQFTYDQNRYKIKSKVSIYDYTNDTIHSMYSSEANYTILQGNATTVKGQSCSSFYDFYNLENKLDLGSFLGEFAGKKNAGLLSSYSSDCHPGPATQPSSSKFSYTLDSSGFVRQQVELLSTYGHRETKATNYKLITDYLYKFQ